MDSFVVPDEVLAVAERKYKDMMYILKLEKKTEPEAHLIAMRIAIHQALVKECQLGLITFTEKSVYWIPENAASYAKPGCPICKGTAVIEVDGTRYLCECTGIESAVPRKR